MISGVRYRQSPRVLSRCFAGEVILTLPDREDLHYLEGTAAVVWEALAQEVTASQLTDFLAEEFRVEAATIQEQVEVFLKELIANGALERYREEEDNGWR